MVARVVFRTEKLKAWDKVRSAGAHNERTRPTPSADGSRQNVVIRSAGGDIEAAIRSRIGDQKIRANAVLAVELVISASAEYFRPGEPDRGGFWEPDRLSRWRAAVEPWILKEFPNAVSVVLHLDEITPHFQVIDVPLDRAGKLNCRQKFGGKQTMVDWQTRAAEPVAHLGIERGIEGSVARHVRIQQFYGLANRPTPQLPEVRTPAPPRLPEPTLAERMPVGQARRERDRIEAQHQHQRAQRAREIQARTEAAGQILPQLAAKAAAGELEERRRRGAEATAARLARVAEHQRREADQLRALPLADVLTRVYGAKEAADSKPSYQSRKFDLPDGRQVGVTADKWIVQGGPGGKGAINLVMQIDEVDFRGALRLLSDHFDGGAITAQRTRDLADQARREVAEVASAPAPTPTPAPARWPAVKRWLEQVRGIPPRLSDWLHRRGLVYSDARANAVFTREGGGAFVRGTGSGSTFKRTIGRADAGTFTLPGDPAAGVWIVEGPVDALAIKAQHPDALVLTTGGNLIGPAQLSKRVPPGAKVFLAFDNNPAGDRLAQAALEAIPTAERRVPPKPYTDWAQCLKNEPQRVSEAWREVEAGSAPDRASEAALEPPEATERATRADRQRPA